MFLYVSAALQVPKPPRSAWQILLRGGGSQRAMGKEELQGSQFWFFLFSFLSDKGLFGVCGIFDQPNDLNMILFTMILSVYVLYNV